MLRVRGHICVLCDNSGTGCGTKNVIYSAEGTICTPTLEPGQVVTEEHSERTLAPHEQYQDLISHSNEQYQSVISSTNDQHHVMSSINHLSQERIADSSGETGEEENNVACIKDQVHKSLKATSIGETSRPVRARIQEHMKKAQMLSEDSFMVDHWCTGHGTVTTQV